jgi:hypothetical protein
MNMQKENLKAVAGKMSKLGMKIPRDVHIAAGAYAFISISIMVTKVAITTM